MVLLRAWQIRLRFILILSAALISVSGCGEQAEEASDLSITLEPSESQIYDFTSSSCYAIQNPSSGVVTKDIQSPMTSFLRLKIQWKKSTDLFIQVITFSLRGSGISGGEKVITFTPEEIDALFKVSTNPTYQGSGLVSPGSETSVTLTSRSNCRINLGGISLADPKNFAIAARGTITIRGLEVATDGTYVRQQATGSFSIVP